MANLEDEIYSTIFTSLKHPARRKILRMLAQKPQNFSEILETLGISSSHLTYHLDNLGELISRTENGKYRLSAFGEAAIATMSKAEEEPKIHEAKWTSSLPLKWKTVFAVLMIGLVVLSGANYIQYQSLTTLSSEYDKLKELVEFVENEQTSLQSKHMLSLKLNRTELPWQGSPFCFVYNPYDNSTLHLVLTMKNPPEPYATISVQNASTFDLTTREAGVVIWSVRATTSNTYSVHLPTKGWYIISLVGPIMTFNNAIGVQMEINKNIDCWMALRISHKGSYTPFIVSSIQPFR